jgi:hypothetical protein
VASRPGHTLVLQSRRGSSNGVERVVGTDSISRARSGFRNLAAMTGGNRGTSRMPTIGTLRPPCAPTVGLQSQQGSCLSPGAKFIRNSLYGVRTKKLCHLPNGTSPTINASLLRATARSPLQVHPIYPREVCSGGPLDPNFAKCVWTASLRDERAPFDRNLAFNSMQGRMTAAPMTDSRAVEFDLRTWAQGHNREGKPQGNDIRPCRYSDW